MEQEKKLAIKNSITHNQKHVIVKGLKLMYITCVQINAYLVHKNPQTQ